MQSNQNTNLIYPKKIIEVLILLNPQIFFSKINNTSILHQLIQIIISILLYTIRIL